MDMRTGKIREIPPGIAKEFEMLFVKGADPAKELKGMSPPARETAVTGYILARRPDPNCPICKGVGHLGHDKRGNVMPCPCVGATYKGKKIGRNEPCPCGSGKKYKYCCWKEV